jgi:hypothetical protein
VQFGRFHAWMLIALGVILLACQAWLVLSPQEPPEKPPERPPVEVTRPEHKFPPIAGIAGGVALVLGIGLYATNRQRGRIANSAARNEGVK